MVFLDAAFPGTADTFRAALQHEEASDFAFYVGGNFALNAWDKALVAELRTLGAGQGMAVYVSTVAGRSGATDGSEAASLARGYGSQPSDRICWDLEPDIFRADQRSAVLYGDAWCDSVRSADFSPVVYSTPDGCAACGNHADGVWAAVPGNPDPGSIFAPSFKPGMVAVQYRAASFRGVSYDVSNSQFTFGAAIARGGFLMALTDAQQQEMYDWIKNLANDMIVMPNRIVVVPNHDGRLHAFMIGLDYQIWHDEQQGTGQGAAWTGWHYLSQAGDRGRSITVQPNQDGRLHAMMIGLDNQIWHNDQLGTQLGAPWSGWSYLSQLGDKARG